jgi:carboxyl-terminal processing protease
MSDRPEIDNSGARSARPLLWAIFLAAGISLGMHVNKEKKDKFSQIFDIIQRDYVDSTKTEQLQEEAIDFMLSQLDPHSSYIPPQLSELNERQIRGNYEGLGIEYIKFRDTLFVFNVMKEGPADKARLLPGDRLVVANGIDLTDSLSSTQIQEAIVGESGSNVRLLVYRRSTNQYLNMNIPRGNIIVNSSEVFYMVNKTLGYIQIERFSSNTHEQFLEALTLLKKNGMQDLIIDLRNNGGGLLNEAVGIANEFLEKDQVISYTFGLHRRRIDYIADGNGIFRQGKLILLINHNTASASEILAGALQDNDRAVVMGNRSFGKGLVQEPFHLSDGSTIRLTIARYYTPSGRSIQKTYTKNIELYRNEIYRRNLEADTLDPILDSTIKKEFFSKNGRFLTSGGGIRPDVFLRDTLSDSTEIETLMPGLFYSRIFDIYLLDHMSVELADLKTRFSDIKNFDRNYQVDQMHVSKLIAIAKTIPYLRNLKYSAKTAGIIRKYLKAAIGYRLFGEIGKSQIINLEEDVFSKSFEVLKKYNRILNISREKSRKFDY